MNIIGAAARLRRSRERRKLTASADSRLSVSRHSVSAWSLLKGLTCHVPLRDEDVCERADLVQLLAHRIEELQAAHLARVRVEVRARARDTISVGAGPNPHLSKSWRPLTFWRL